MGMDITTGPDQPHSILITEGISTTDLPDRHAVLEQQNLLQIIFLYTY